MTTTEALPTKHKHLIGIGAAIAAGCQPCTSAFVAAARDAGACERGVRFSLEGGLAARGAATEAMALFGDASFAHPELDDAFRAERALLGALIGVAAAMAGNAAPLVRGCVEAARALGATEAQLRIAVQLGRQARRGAEDATEAAFGAVSLGASGQGCGCDDGGAGGGAGTDATPTGTCGCRPAGPGAGSQPAAASTGGCGCGAREVAPAGT